MSVHDRTAEKEDGPKSDQGSNDERRKPRIDWTDPNVPIGNAPKYPKWPLVLSVGAWLAWIVFLLAMLLTGTGGAAS